MIELRKPPPPLTLLILSVVLCILPGVMPGCTTLKAQDSLLHFHRGAIVRGDTAKQAIALVFTGDEYGEGGIHIAQSLKKHQVKASFFLTGKFYRNPEFRNMLEILATDGHYLGAHSDQHLLYCDWQVRDSLLVSKKTFEEDLAANYSAMEAFGITMEQAPYFLPPYEWYNDSIATWTREMGLQLINMSHGTLSHTDYTLPTGTAYRGSREILQSILDYEGSTTDALNGFILLSHIGTSPERSDKFYLLLDELIMKLRKRGYSLVRIDELLD